MNGNNVVTLFKITFSKIDSRSKASYNDENFEQSSSEDEKVVKECYKDVSMSNK